jgi:hypothetical protein
METNDKPNSTQTWDLALAVIAAILLLSALILNYYRYELFGVVHHNAPNNFWFNITFFIPLTVLSLSLSVIVNFRVFFNWADKPNKIKKLISLILTTPIIILFIASCLRLAF